MGSIIEITPITGLMTAQVLGNRQVVLLDQRGDAKRRAALA